MTCSNMPAPASQPCPADGGPVQLTTQAIADQRTAALAKQYAAEFQQLLAGTHGATLAHPDTVVMCEDKFEATAYRAMLDASGFAHIPVKIKEKQKFSRRMRRQMGVNFRKPSKGPQ